MDQADIDHDDLLLYLIYQMDESSLQEFLQKYARYNRAQLRFYLNAEELEGNEEDCLAELNAMLMKAVYAYRRDQNVLFSTYYHCFLEHYIANYRRQFWSFQNRSQKNTLSLDAYVSDYSTKVHHDYVANRDITLEGIYALYTEQRNHILRRLFRDMSALECRVILLKLEGFTYEAIGKKLNMDARQVEYILAKVRKSKALID